MARSASTRKSAAKKTPSDKSTAGKNGQPVREPNKQAVVVIHGMGEQRPMGTLRTLVETVWEKDPSVGKGGAGPNQYWIKPDTRAGLQELSRITTDFDRRGRRTDFYEFYWADLMQGTTWQHLWSWVRGLLFRAPVSVPWDVFPVWIALWLTVLLLAAAGVSVAGELGLPICTPGPVYLVKSNPVCSGLDWASSAVTLLVIVVLFAILGALIKTFAPWRGLDDKRSWLFLPVVATIVVVFGFLAVQVYGLDLVHLVALPMALALLHRALVPYFGDVARYVQAGPANVEKRKLVRDRGTALLRALHDSADYDRIIIVAHSLGTIVAYDLINQFWTERGPSYDNPPDAKTATAFDTLDRWMRDNGSIEESSRAAFRAMQRDVSKALAATGFRHDGKEQRGSNWLISDFVTVGSPLTHAEFLLARTDEGLNKLKSERVLPVCPPWPEPTETSGGESFLYRRSDADQPLPHHATAFAAVRWINIYDRHNWLAFLLGDVVSGPVADHFGNGIEDVEVKIGKGSVGLPRFFTHAHYWAWDSRWDTAGGVPETHIKRLREAVNLLDRTW